MMHGRDNNNMLLEVASGAERLGEVRTHCQRLPVAQEDLGRGKDRTEHMRAAGDGWGLGIQGSPAPVGQEGDLTNIGLSHEEVKHDT